MLSGTDSKNALFLNMAKANHDALEHTVILQDWPLEKWARSSFTFQSF